MQLTQERTNQEWLEQLREEGLQGDAARRDLRATLVRGLRRALAGRVPDESYFEDWAQDALVRVLESLSTFRDESRFTSWALAIAMRAAFTELRRARWKDVSLDALAGDADAPLGAQLAQGSEPESPERHLGKVRLLEVLERTFRTELTDRQRQLIIAELRDMPQEELCRHLGTNRNALYKLGHDARKSLRRGLEQAGITAEHVSLLFEA